MMRVKCIYSEKAKFFCEIFTLFLSVCTVDKSKVKISQNCVVFSEYRTLSLFHKLKIIKTYFLGVVDCPEFLVHFPTLVELADKHGLMLICQRRFDSYFNSVKLKLRASNFLHDRTLARKSAGESVRRKFLCLQLNNSVISVIL